MPRIWKPLPKEFPTDGATVWVTPSNQFNPPFLATFDLAAFEFTDVVSSAVMPWYVIARWKPDTTPPPPTTLLQDNFSGTAGTLVTAHTPAIGGPYSLVNGSNAPELDGANGLKAVAQSSSTSQTAAAAVPASTDYFIQAQFHRYDNAGNFVHPMGWLQAAGGDSYYIQWSEGAGEFRVFRVSGGFTIMDSAAFSLSTSNDAIVALHRVGTGFGMTINGTPVGSGFVDSSLPLAGQVGYFCESNADGDTTGTHLQNMLVDV